MWTHRFLSINKWPLWGEKNARSFWLLDVKSCPMKCYAKSGDENGPIYYFACPDLMQILLGHIVFQRGTIFQPKARPPKVQTGATMKPWSSAS